MTGRNQGDNLDHPQAVRPADLPAAAGIFLLALGVRLLYLRQSAAFPTFHLPVVDSLAYDRAARALAGGAIDNQFFWQSPLYPLFLSAVYFLKGTATTAKLLQAGLGALTAVLAWLLGRLAGGRGVGLMAGAATALYGPLVFFEGELLSAGWEAFWSVGLVLLAMACRRSSSTAVFPVFGAAGGLAVLTRPTFFPFFLAAGLWALSRPGGAAGRRRRRWPAAAMAAAFLAAVLPAALLCRAVTGRFTFMPAAGGINAYIGNNPDLCATLTARPGFAWNRLNRLPTDNGAGGFWAGSDWFYREAARLAIGRPRAFAAGLASKALRFINARELPRNLDIYLFRRWSRLLAVLVWKVGPFGFPFGALLPLAVIGIVFGRRRLPAPMGLFLALCPAAIVIVFVAARYRAALAPVLAVAAALGAASLAAMIRRRQGPRLAFALGLGAATIIAATLPAPFCEEKLDWEADLCNSLGVSADRGGGLDEALAWFRAAARRRPGMFDAYNNAGAALARRGRFSEAAKEFTRALEIMPGAEEALNNKGYALAGLGRYDEAEACYREALAAAPRYAPALNNLGNALAAVGRPAEAAEMFRRAVRIEPDYAHAHFNLAETLAQSGSWEEAAAAYRAVLRLRPRDGEARLGLEEAAGRLGKAPASGK